jgi:uncharacterized protein DUF3558
VVKGRYIVLLVAAGLASACTATVAGTAQPAPGGATAPPRASTDPCSLLTNDEAAQLGLKGPGAPKAAQPRFRTPPSCTWLSANPDASYDDSLEAYYSTDIPIDSYYSGPPTKQEQLGGVTWSVYPSAIGDFMCDLAVKLSGTSFVALSSQNLADTSKACEIAEKAAPVVAKQLPK